MCGLIRPSEAYYWYAYTTNQGKRSVRRNKYCKDCAKASRKELRGDDAARYSKAWRDRNSERVAEYAADYRGSSRGKSKRSKAQAARYAREKAGLDGPEKPEILSLYQAAKDLEAKLAACVICDDPLEMKIHVDHVVPLSKGGAHAASNLQLLSARENLAKGANG